MNIGLGITTYNRPDHLSLCLDSFHKNTTGVDLYIARDSDEDHRGIAYRKNECLRYFRNHDIVILADDDIVFKKPGWIDFFINAHKASGQHHFMYLKETNVIKKTDSQQWINGAGIIRGIAGIPYKESKATIDIFNNCSGCLLFLTKEVINKVGAFGDYSNPYGMEHCGYTERIHLAGLTPLGKYLCPAGASEYIHSLDLDGLADFNIDHFPSLIGSIDKINAYIGEGMKNFVEDIKQIYRPL